MAEVQNRSEHILVVDDDVRIRQMLIRYFEDEGYRVSAAADGQAMRECLQGTQIDIILLDLVMPGGDDGLVLAREIRSRSDVPIIMLTGRDDVVDRIVGLEVGADDYISKPFHLREVLARLRTVLRRRLRAVTPPRSGRRGFRFRRLASRSRPPATPDRGRRRRSSSRPASLTYWSCWRGIPERVFTRDMLMDLTRGRTLEAFDRTIDAQIARLRKKIERDPRKPELIKSVRGVGYVFTGKPAR